MRGQRGCVKHYVHADAGTEQRIAIQQLAGTDLVSRRKERAVAARIADQCANPVAAGGEVLYNQAADESICARDQSIHIQTLVQIVRHASALGREHTLGAYPPAPGAAAAVIPQFEWMLLRHVAAG